MSTAPLTTTSYLVLGCLANQGPCTPYQLKQAVAAGVGYFWSFPHSQLYSEPARLAGLGLVAEQREATGRRRRIFKITPAGRRELKRWVADPTDDLPEIRDTGLLKLFFGQHVSAPQLASLARSQRAAHEQRLAVYEEFAQAAGDAHTGPAATLAFGLAYERAAVEFWT